tara:strand:- start:188 stop:355 length:168 start_codon:yes stop_codon:yes gene_type:complete
MSQNILRGIEGENQMVGFFLILGFICLILAPFTGITVVGAAAFFVIAYILHKMGF